MIRFGTFCLFALVPRSSDAQVLSSLCGYTPKTKITDEAALDLDVETILDRLRLGQIAKARNVYESGGFSLPVARLTLINPRGPLNFPAGSKVFGITKEGFKEVYGHVRNAVEWPENPGNVTVEVSYFISKVQEYYVGCHVGGLYTFEDAVLDGCFSDGVSDVEFVLPDKEKGTGEILTYTYDVRRDNINLRTLQGLSKNALVRTRPCESCPVYNDFQLFMNFYGSPKYGDEWIMAASVAEQTNFDMGNADFAGAKKITLAEAFLHGIVALNMYMKIVREVEAAAYMCSTNCNERGACLGASHLNALDRAVAFYCGSKAGEDDEGSGVLLHSLSRRRDNEFHPIFKDSESAEVQDPIVSIFRAMQAAMLHGDCAATLNHKDEVLNAMKVPLIQSVLRYAYIRENEDLSGVDDSEKAEALGASFAAAILPFVNQCNPEDAQVLYENMKIGSSPLDVSFRQVKGALEKNYKCLGVTCEAIGGVRITLSDTEFAESAGPCVDKEIQTMGQTRKAGPILGFSVVVVLLFVLVFKFYAPGFGNRGSNTVTRRKRSSNIAAVSELA